jgi:hypothetical protein
MTKLLRATVVLLAFGTLSCEAPPPREEVTMTYKVTGAAKSASITILNEQGGTEQHDFKVPVNYPIRVYPGAFVSIIAQNMGSGDMACDLEVEGVSFRHAKSTAQFGVVTCSGNVPEPSAR